MRLVRLVMLLLLVAGCGGKTAAAPTPTPTPGVTYITGQDLAGQTDGGKLCAAAAAFRQDQHYGAAYRAAIRAQALQGSACADLPLKTLAAEYAGALCAQADVVADTDKAAATAMRKQALALGDTGEKCAAGALITVPKKAYETT